MSGGRMNYFEDIASFIDPHSKELRDFQVCLGRGIHDSVISTGKCKSFDTQASVCVAAVKIPTYSSCCYDQKRCKVGSVVRVAKI